MKQYNLGRTKEERNKVFKDIVNSYENNNVSLQNIADKYGVSIQAISGFLLRRGYCPRKEIKEIGKKINVLAKGTLLEEKVKELYDRKRTLECEMRMYRTKYRNARNSLQEIKNIAEAMVNGIHFTDDIEEHLKELAKQILNKINEVLDEKESS